jgi:hypothetical protein
MNAVAIMETRVCPSPLLFFILKMVDAHTVSMIKIIDTLQNGIQYLLESPCLYCHFLLIFKIFTLYIVLSTANELKKGNKYSNIHDY